MFVHHVETSIGILPHQGNARAFQRRPLAVARPGPHQLPRANSLRVFDRRLLPKAQYPNKIDDVQISIPRQLTESRIVRPTEIAAAPAKPVRRDFKRIASNFSSLVVNMRSDPIVGTPRVRASRSCSG